MALNREQWAHLALIQWNSFLHVLSAIEPELTFDLWDHPPVFLQALKREAGEHKPPTGPPGFK